MPISDCFCLFPRAHFLSLPLYALFLALSWHSRFHLFMTADTVCVQVGMVPPVAMAAGKHKLTSLSHAGVRNSSQTERITFLSHTHTKYTTAYTKMYNCTHTYTMYNQTHTNHPSTWFSGLEKQTGSVLMFSLANKIQTDLVTVHTTVSIHYCHVSWPEVWTLNANYP